MSIAEAQPERSSLRGRLAQAGGDGRLIANLMHFARTLRAAGLPVGPGKVIDAVTAFRTVGITDRADFYWTLHAVFVNRPDQRPSSTRHFTFSGATPSCSRR